MGMSYPYYRACVLAALATVGCSTPPPASQPTPAAESKQVRQAAPASQPAPAAPPTQPAFSAGDEWIAARALCDAASRGVAVRKTGLEDEKVPGFIGDDGSLYEVLLSAGYAEQGIATRAFVLGGHAVADGVIIDAHGQTATIAAAVLEYRDGQWTMAASSRELTTAGSSGYAPSITLRRTGESSHAIELTWSWTGQGQILGGVALYERRGTAFREVLDLLTNASDCGISDDCYTFESSLTATPGSGAGFFDLVLAPKGTYRVSSDKIASVPPAPIILRRQDGTYMPAPPSAEMDAFWKVVGPDRLR